FITPRQGGEVIGNNSSEVISVQAPVQTADEVPIAPASAQKKSVEYVVVTGQVSQPGVYEFRNGIASLEELIDQAGGLTSFSNREFFVYRTGTGYLELDLQTQANFQLQNGDILLAETPVRYYRELNLPDSRHDLYKLHDKTQIIMFNLADRPVLLTVPPTGARMPALLELLKQSPAAMVGVQRIPPPHSQEIPKHAQLAPGLIPSSSIVIFDPKRIDPATLPTLPPPMIAEPARSIRVAYQETPASTPRSHELKPSGLFEWQKISRDAPMTEFNSSQAVANHALLGSKDTPPADKPLSIDRPASEESSKIAKKTSAKTKAKKRSQPQKLIFSRQQKTIVIGFLVVVGLFIVAYLVRKKQEQRELLPLAADTAKHTNSIISLYATLKKRFSGQTTAHSELEKLEAASETVSSVAEAASSVAELVSESDTEVPESEKESVRPLKGVNPEVENRLVQFVNQITSSADQKDRSLVELLVELAAVQENRDREAFESSSRQPAEPAQAEAAPLAKAPVSIEAPAVSQPMFPMIWEQKLEQPGAPVHSQTAVPEESVSAPEARVPSTPQGDHPVTQGPHRIPLDRVFFAAQRERGHKETVD
ncbi:MAG TPA: SLBB domain-containing protein, partial [Planctomycetaceae bacterium]|nr:SLBB domain-containing protein [Planctomycetaceae bacterium]